MKKEKPQRGVEIKVPSIILPDNLSIEEITIFAQELSAEIKKNLLHHLHEGRIY